MTAAGTLAAYRKPLLWSGAIVMIAAGTYLHYDLFTKQQTWIDTSCLKDYPLTSRTLDCANYDESQARMHAVDAAVDTAVAGYLKRGTATHISVWTRNLETRQWASTNETDRYAPASMMKVPIMVAYYKLAELDPSVLSQQFPYAPAPQHGNDIEDIRSATPLVNGQSYTVDQLIDAMIIDSDNDAMYILATRIDQGVLNKTLVDLGISIPKNTKQYDFVTAKSFANIYRILYNASYLDRSDSQKALDRLSHSAYKPLAKDIPAGTTVASKFGERVITDPDGSVESAELHDCGIVYKGTEPYSICIMTAGPTLDGLKSIVSDLSDIVYENI